MSKFLLNILVQISKALVNTDIQFLSRKFFFLAFGPTDLAAQPAQLASLLSWAEFNLASPASPRVNGVIAKVRFPFWFAPSELAASFSSLCQVGPGCQIRLPPPPADRCHFLSSPPATPCRPTSNINGVKAITVGRFPLPRPGVPLPDHYKRMRSTPRPSPHSPRPQSLASESAAPTPPSASSADHSPPSPGRVRPSAAPSCSR
jgi:hypothetical protein